MISRRTLPDHGQTTYYGKADEFVPQPFVTVVENVTICGPTGVGFLGDDVILETAYSGRLDVLERNRPYLNWAVACRRELLPTKIPHAISLVGVWSGNYFHWITEFLPKLEIISDKIPVLIEKHPAKFITDSLDKMGRTYIRLTHPHLKIGFLSIASTRRYNGHTEKGAVDWLRKTFVPNKVQRTDRYYITREDSDERHILNDSELREDRIVIKPEKMSFTSQVAAFRMAKEIVGPHGAGMTNMVWSKKAKITEYFGSYINPCMENLAAVCGHKYKRVQGNAVGVDITI